MESNIRAVAACLPVGWCRNGLGMSWVPKPRYKQKWFEWYFSFSLCVMLLEFPCVTYRWDDWNVSFAGGTEFFLYCLALHPHTSCWDGNMHCRCLHSIFFLFPWRSCDGSLPPGLADDMLAMPHCWVMWSDRWYRTTEESQACWARRWCLQEAKSCCRNDIANWHLSLSFC